MNNKLLTKILIWGFLFLYLLIAGVSFFHAIEFFGIGNVRWMAVTLSIGFEIGLALSLAAVLLSDDNRKNILPWILMIVLCAVQCCGNVYSTYKYIALSGTEYYQYLAKPLLFWMEGVTVENVQIVVSWIIGAILPIIALFMTDMVATNIKNLNNDKMIVSDSDINDIAEKQADGQNMIPTSLPKPEKDKTAVQKESTPIIDKNDVSEDFQNTAVQNRQVPAENQEQVKKPSFLKRIKNLLTKEQTE